MLKWPVLFILAAFSISCSSPERRVSVETKKAVPGDAISVTVASTHFIPGGWPLELNIMTFELVSEEDPGRRYAITKLMTSSSRSSFGTLLKIPEEAKPGLYQLVLPGQEIKKCPNPGCLEVISPPSRQGR